MHGSGGIGGNIGYWKRQLNAMGVSTFVIDGMTGRGLTGVGDKQATLGRLNFILDIYRSLEILAKHPRVDPNPHYHDGVLARRTGRTLLQR